MRLTVVCFTAPALDNLVRRPITEPFRSYRSCSRLSVEKTLDEAMKIVELRGQMTSVPQKIAEGILTEHHMKRVSLTSFVLKNYRGTYPHIAYAKYYQQHTPASERTTVQQKILTYHARQNHPTAPSKTGRLSFRSIGRMKYPSPRGKLYNNLRHSFVACISMS